MYIDIYLACSQLSRPKISKYSIIRLNNKHPKTPNYLQLSRRSHFFIEDLSKLEEKLKSGQIDLKKRAELR